MDGATEIPEVPSSEASSEPQPLRRETFKTVPKPFDFRHPVFLSSPEWRKVRMEVEEFIESLAALLSTYLRVEFSLQLGKMQTQPFSEFVAGAAPRTHLTLFKLEPLRGVSVLELRPAIGLAIVDRLLGGPGKPAETERNLTDMEVALLDQSVQIMLGEWCKQWSRFQELRAEILGHENNPKFLQCASGESTVLLVTIEARMGEVVDQIQFAFPYHALEPLVNKLTQSGSSPAPAAAAAQVSPLKWNRALDDVAVTVTAGWPALRLPTGRMFRLKAGDVLDLQPESAEKIELRIGKLVLFRGRLGVREGKWAIQINSVCKNLL